MKDKEIMGLEIGRKEMRRVKGKMLTKYYWMCGLGFGEAELLHAVPESVSTDV